MKKRKYVEIDKTAEDAAEEKRGIFSNVDKWGVFKTVIGMVASGCASVVVNRYLNANLPASENLAEKVAVSVGTYFITGLVGAKVSEYAEGELEKMRPKAEIEEKGEADDGEA